MKKILSFLTLSCLVMTLAPISHAQSSSIVFNEIGAFEANNTEWIELYNSSSTAIDMDGYRFYENETNHNLTLFHGSDMILEPGEIAVIGNKSDELLAKYPQLSSITIFDSSWSNLNKTGETIALTYNDEIVHQITFGESDTGSLQYIGGQWIEKEGAHSIGMVNTVSEDTSEELEEEVLPPQQANDGVVLLDHQILPPNLSMPGAFPMSMVLVLTKVEEEFDPANQYNPYSFMLYYLDEYQQTLSLTDYLQKLSDGFDTPLDTPDDSQENIPEDPEEENQDAPEHTSIPDSEQEEPTQDTPSEEENQYELENEPEDSYDEVPDQEVDEFEKTCLAWWEQHMSVSE